MRILHATTHQDSGAGRAALRIHRAVRASGADSSVLALYASNPGLHVRIVAGLQRRAERALLSLLGSAGGNYRSLGLLGSSGAAKIRAERPDIVHLHWIPGLLRIADLPAIDCPVVWTFHDAWPILGVQHYDDTRQPRSGIDRWVFERKQYLWRNFAPIIVAPSRWLAEEARRSPLFGARDVHVIPNPVDTALFHPQDRAEARARLGLPADRILLLHGAWNSATDRRKGFHVLTGALGQLASRGHADKADLVVFGASGSERVGGLRTHWQGFIADDARLAALYSACDIVIIPSLQDNLPNILVEAMACGAAAVGSATGGIPDLIREGETGLLAPPGDASALSRQLERLLGDAALRARLGQGARRRVELACNERAVGAAYLELYRAALERRRPGGARRNG